MGRISVSPLDAAFLGRSLVAVAAALSAPNPPKANTIASHAHLPITIWKVGISNVNGEQILILAIPSGIELTFQFGRAGAREIGAALVAQADRYAPPGGHSGVIN
jgi:hypothetical protein